MVAAYGGEDDRPTDRRVPAANVVQIARHNLEIVRDAAIEEVEALEGEQAAMDLIDRWRDDPEAVAWYARSYGYNEGRNDSAADIARLQARIAELERHSLSERLFGIVAQLDGRVRQLGEQVDTLHRTLVAGGAR